MTFSCRHRSPLAISPSSTVPTPATGCRLYRARLHWSSAGVQLPPMEIVTTGKGLTQVDALAGYRPATDGQVLVDGAELYKHFDSFRSGIGFVPQRDIIHRDLTVFEALDYAAQLRLPPETTTEERHQRIEEVMAELDL